VPDLSPAPTLPGRDIVRFGTAVTLVVALGAVQVFVIPRRLELSTYGEYRLFLVYVGYIGVLHFGFADGAFVRWSGMAPGRIHGEWRRLIGWMLAVEGAVLAVAATAALAIGDALIATYLVAFGACALFVNASVLSAYALQTAGEFREAGTVAVIAPAVFVVVVLLAPLHSLAAVLGAYAASFALSAAIGAAFVMRLPPPAESARGPIAIAGIFRTGFHVLGANLAAGLAQSADRILVSIALPITSMALYGFASSVAVAGTSATQTMQRVALSHAARRDGPDRALFLGRFYSLTLAAYGIALAGMPLFEHVVSSTLPAYASALPIVRAFVAGAPFWVALHVVLVGTLQSHTMVRRQFALELGGAALVAAACAACLAMHTPLWVVAAAASAAAVVTWGAGIVLVNRAVPAARSQGAARFAALCIAQVLSIAIALSLTDEWSRQTLLYVLLAAAPTFLAIRASRVQWR
jgi:O-antigen/teichoic acid export membrane protein